MKIRKILSLVIAVTLSTLCLTTVYAQDVSSDDDYANMFVIQKKCL